MFPSNELFSMVEERISQKMSEEAINKAFEKFWQMLQEHIETMDGINRYRSSKLIGFDMKIGQSPEQCYFFKLILLENVNSCELQELEECYPLNKKVIEMMKENGWYITEYSEDEVFIFAIKN